MKNNDIVTKEQMLEHLGWDSKKDRQLRDLLSMIGKKVPLMATSDSKGYKIAKTKVTIIYTRTTIIFCNEIISS